MKSPSTLFFVALSIILIAATFLNPSFSGNAQEQPPNQNTVVVLFLNDQGEARIARQVQQEYHPELDILSLELQSSDPFSKTLSSKPTLATRQEEANYLKRLNADQPLSATALDAHQRAWDSIQDIRRRMRQEILERTSAARLESQQAIRAVEALGGEVVYRYDTLNAIAVRVSPDQVAALKSLPGVVSVMENTPLSPALDISARAIGARGTWWFDNYTGYSGSGASIAVIDTGIDRNHPALSAHNIQEKQCLYVTGGLPYDTTTDDINGHGTHIAGIVGSRDSLYRGVAWGMSSLINAKAGYSTNGLDNGSAIMWPSDAMACADWAVSPSVGADALNLSWGGPTEGEDDGDFERFWDALVDTWDAVVAIAAGNSGPGSSTLLSPGIAYNVISVANINDNNNTDRNYHFIDTTSSRGPTPSGRKKPDLAAPGTSIISTDNSWETTSGFISYTGTSMAAPHVAGAAGLLMGRGVTSPMAIKALLINSAEDKGSTGWDNAYGWGYIDLAALSFNINDYFLGSVAASPDFHLYAGQAYLNDRATLAWHRRVVYTGGSYPSTYYTLTNLDLLAYNQTSNSLVLSSTSAIDNVEVTQYNSAFPVVLKVDAVSGSIGGASSEDYALATEENFSQVYGPSFGFTYAWDGDIKGPAGEVFTVTVTAHNTGDLKAHDVTLSQSPSAGLTKLSGSDTPVALGTLTVGGQSGGTTWTYQKTAGGVQWVYFTAASNSYGETFTSLGIFGGYQLIFPIIYNNSP